MNPDLNKLWTHMKANWVATVVTALLALAGLTVSITQTDNPTPNGGHVKTISFHVDKSTQAGTQTGTIVIPAKVQAQVAPAVENGLKNEQPTGMSQTQVKAVEQKAAQIKATLPGLPTGGATAEYPGCRTEFIGSYGSRNGVRPDEFVLHLTVSPNVPGWADVNSVVHLFANEEASSNFVLDGEGHCAYIVPIEQKAWTQAGGNPFSISVEVIDTGKESIYLAPPGMAELRRIVQAVSARTGIPIRLGSVSNSCTPIVSGIIQHKDWGICGGGHVDITPYSVPAIVKYLQAGAKVSKAQTWTIHLKANHVKYQKLCKHAYQRRARPVTCNKIRVESKRLRTLLARKHG